MPHCSLRSFSNLASGFIIAGGRRGVLDFTKQPGLRPLHASPIFQSPRRRDFFSSNATLASQSDGSRDGKNSEATASSESLQGRKRKVGGAAAAKTSLRRVAVEAQRSRDGKLPQSSFSPRYVDDASSSKLVTAYAVAERFDLAKVVEILRSKGYEPDPLSTGLYPQVVHIQIPISSIYRSTNPTARDLNPSEIGDVFIFPSGTVVTWALPEGFTSYFATRTLAPAAEQPHREPIENEDLEYIEDSTREHSAIKGETIILGTKPPARSYTTDSSLDNPSSPYQPQTVDTVLTKIAFSSGFARSTKLAILETSLSTYLTSTSDIPRLLAKGSRLPYSISRRFILRKTGELLLLRAQLNLYSELTDSLPDLFWDSRHELNLESYYDQVGKALDVGIRIKLLNEKMDYAGEIATVLRERLSEKHGLFLEWTIIILIAIEVGFEILRLWKEGFWAEVFDRRQVPTEVHSNSRQRLLLEEDLTSR